MIKILAKYASFLKISNYLSAKKTIRISFFLFFFCQSFVDVSFAQTPKRVFIPAHTHGTIVLHIGSDGYVSQKTNLTYKDATNGLICFRLGEYAPKSNVDEIFSLCARLCARLCAQKAQLTPLFIPFDFDF